MISIHSRKARWPLPLRLNASMPHLMLPLISRTFTFILGLVGTPATKPRQHHHPAEPVAADSCRHQLLLCANYANDSAPHVGDPTIQFSQIYSPFQPPRADIRHNSAGRFEAGWECGLCQMPWNRWSPAKAQSREFDSSKHR